MKMEESEIQEFFKNDPYRSILHPIILKYQEEVRNKAKDFFKKSQGHLRGWQHHVWSGHSIHNTFEDENDGFHFFVNTRYIPLEPLLSEVRKAGLDIDGVKVSGNGMRLAGDTDTVDKPEVFVRVVKKRKR